MNRGAVGTSPDRSAVRWGGVGALLSGAVFLGTVGYTFGVLAHLGLSVEMLDDPAELLPWIAAHTGAYQGLWWIYLASFLLLLPAPLGVLAVVPLRGSAPARVGAAAGLLGIAVGVVSVAVNLASAPGLAHAARGGVVPPAEVYLLSEIAGATALHLRLFSDLLVAGWLGLVGVALRSTGAAPRLAWALIATAGFVLAAAVAKAVGWADLEPVLGFVLALVYVALGAWLLRWGSHAGVPAAGGAADRVEIAGEPVLQRAGE